MQEEFLYLESQASRSEQLYWKLPLISILSALIFAMTLFSAGHQALILAVFAVFFSLPIMLLGIFSGKSYWYRIIRKEELPDAVREYAVPRREAAYESLKSFKKTDINANYPYAIGFSASNGEALWLEEESLNMGLSVFSRSAEDHLQFSLSLLLQHLLQASAAPVIVMDLRVDARAEDHISKIVNLAGRREDYTQSRMDVSSFCFNPFKKSYSTEAKAKKLILMANLLLNNAATGSSLGAETEDFFFRLARCLDSFNPDWTIRHVSEIFQDFQTVSSQLNRHFEITRQSQGILDLAQIEKYLQQSNADSNLQKLLKILSLALSHLFQKKDYNISASAGLDEILSAGKILYYSAEADRSVTQLAAGLLAEELKAVVQSRQADSFGSPLLLILADQLTRIPNLEAFTDIVKSEKAIVVFSGGKWQPEIAPLEKDFVDKKSKTISNAVYFNFQLTEKAQLYTQQGSISEFCPFKVSFTDPQTGTA